MTPFTHACKARPLTVVGWTSLSVTVIVIVRLEDMFEQVKRAECQQRQAARPNCGRCSAGYCDVQVRNGFRKEKMRVLLGPWLHTFLQEEVMVVELSLGLDTSTVDCGAPPTGVGRSSWEGMDNCGTCTSSRVYSDAYRVSKQLTEWSI